MTGLKNDGKSSRRKNRPRISAHRKTSPRDDYNSNETARKKPRWSADWKLLQITLLSLSSILRWGHSADSQLQAIFGRVSPFGMVFSSKSLISWKFIRHGFFEIWWKFELKRQKGFSNSEPIFLWRPATLLKHWEHTRWDFDHASSSKKIIAIAQSSFR